MLDRLQWQIDDKTATRIFDDGTEAGLNRYDTFRKCHEEPPAKEANKKTCAALQKRVADAEARETLRQEKEQANW